MIDTHTSVERILKIDITAKNEIRLELKKSAYLIRRLSEILRKCKNHGKISRYEASIERHSNKVEQLRIELLPQLEKETREMEAARSKLDNTKAARSNSPKSGEQEKKVRRIARATRQLLRETADVKKIEKELSSEEKDKILFTHELKIIESDKLIYGQ